MRLLILLLLLFVQACSTLPYEQEHWQALRHFTYIPDDSRDEWDAYTTINHHFAGDCEDFAFTLQRNIGGKVWKVHHPKYGYHAILIKGMYAYDNLNKLPILKTDLEKQGVTFISIMDFRTRGILIKN